MLNYIKIIFCICSAFVIVFIAGCAEKNKITTENTPISSVEFSSETDNGSTSSSPEKESSANNSTSSPKETNPTSNNSKGKPNSSSIKESSMNNVTSSNQNDNTASENWLKASNNEDILYRKIEIFDSQLGQTTTSREYKWADQSNITPITENTSAKLLQIVAENFAIRPTSEKVLYQPVFPDIRLNSGSKLWFDSVFINIDATAILTKEQAEATSNQLEKGTYTNNGAVQTANYLTTFNSDLLKFVERNLKTDEFVPYDKKVEMAKELSNTVKLYKKGVANPTAKHIDYIYLSLEPNENGTYTMQIWGTKTAAVKHTGEIVIP